MQEIQDIKITLAEIKMQLGLIVADMESEKDTRKRRNEGIDNRLREIEDWKNKQQGKMIATIVIVGIVWTVLTTAAILYLK